MQLEAHTAPFFLSWTICERMNTEGHIHGCYAVTGVQKVVMIFSGNSQECPLGQTRSDWLFEVDLHDCAI